MKPKKVVWESLSVTSHTTVAAAGLAALSKRFYSLYDSAERYDVLHRQVCSMWSEVAKGNVDSAVLAYPPAAVRDLTAPDVDRDQSQWAGLAQSASLVVATATEFIATGDTYLYAELCDWFGELKDHASHTEEDEKWYSDQLRALAGLSAEEMDRRLDEVNRTRRPSGRKEQIRRQLRSLEASLFAILVDSSLPIAEKCKLLNSEIESFDPVAVITPNA